MTNQAATRPRSATVVAEWENVRLAELDRARRMLAELARQVAALGSGLADGGTGGPVCVDVVIVYDSELFSDEAVRRSVEESLPEGASLPLRLLAAPGASYYEQKNRGAEVATGEVVVFLDSDVVPEEGWLQALLTPFSLAWVNAAAGNSYVEPVSLYAKAFALTWFFPLRDHEGRRGLVKHFYANNVAFRRGFFLARRFQEAEGETRGACARLAQSIWAEGGKIAYEGAARVSHPTPNGLRHYVERGIAQGRDNVVGGRRASRSVADVLRRYAKTLQSTTSRVIANRKAVDLSPAGVPLVVAVSWGFYTLAFVGEVASMVAPRFMSRRFQL